jgi:hypothetical protein
MKKEYPFEEGDKYFTIEGNTVVESCWDCQSEEMHDENPNRTYFKTVDEASMYYQLKRTREMLSSVMSYVEDNQESPSAKDLVEAYNYFNHHPKFSLIN